jgi:hypothetical protein
MIDAPPGAVVGSSVAAATGGSVVDPPYSPSRDVAADPDGPFDAPLLEQDAAVRTARRTASRNDDRAVGPNDGLQVRT